MATTTNAKYDLTHEMAPFLDLHMIFPILQWLQDKKMYNSADLQQAVYDATMKTCMMDYAIDQHEALYGKNSAPTGLQQKKRMVAEDYEAGLASVAPLLDLMDNVEEVNRLKLEEKFNMEGLVEAGIDERALDNLYGFAKMQMDCGIYPEAAENLKKFRKLAPADSERSFQAMWGQLAADILNYNHEAALTGVHSLRDAIEARTNVSPLEQLQQRSWLVHWSMFVFWPRPDGARLICEFFFQNNTERGQRNRNRESTAECKYIHAIQTNCPWMLRYLSAAVIIQKWRRNVNELITVIQQQRAAFDDPITGFLDCLFIQHDLEGAKLRLVECESLLQSDYFFSVRGNEFVNEFMSSGRKLIFKRNCLIHHKIDLKALAADLHMEQEEAERWMVDMIRNSNLSVQLDNAKIDSKNNLAIMDAKVPSVYERIREKTKDINNRVYELASNINSARGI